MNTYILRSHFFLKIVPFIRKCGKVMWIGTVHGLQCGACALHVGYVWLQTHTEYVMLFHCSSGCTDTSQCCVMCTSAVCWVLHKQTVLLGRLTLRLLNYVDRLALRPGKPVSTYVFICIDPLCAACVCFPPSSTGAPVPIRACGPLVGEPRTARAERSPLLAR
jgi:hypothetical protein